MKAWQFDNSRPNSGVTLVDVPIPQAGAGELLIRVHAAGVTPGEAIWYPTTHDKSGQPRPTAIPGHEFSGAIARVGAAADSAAPKSESASAIPAEFNVGQEVFGVNDWFGAGAMAEYCLASAESLAAKPARLSHASAASIPISALTAWQGLFDRAKLQPGERVLIQGGAGAVGVFAVQLARRHGAKVFATASQRNLEFLDSLGIERAIDYHAQRFEDIATQIDVVFDTVGGATLDRSWKVLAPGGRLVTVATRSETLGDQRTNNAFFIVESNGQQLRKIAALIDSGELQPVVDAALPFLRADLAYGGQIPGQLGRGKVVVTMTA